MASVASAVATASAAVEIASAVILLLVDDFARATYPEDENPSEKTRLGKEIEVNS